MPSKKSTTQSRRTIQTRAARSQRQSVEGVIEKSAPSPAPPAPSRGRLRTFWHVYCQVCKRANISSTAWWQMKIMQGSLLGGGLLGLGLLLALGLRLAGGSAYWGLGVCLVGLVVFLRYLAAPRTCRWIVTVPENWYYVVEDGDGFTIEYLGQGKMIVPWRWKSVVREYVNFNFISVGDIVIQNVLNSKNFPANLEILVEAQFDPTRASVEMYGVLRQMNTPAVFEAMLTKFVKKNLRSHFSTVASVPQVDDVQALADQLEQQLEDLNALGVFVLPITVHMGTPQDREAYRQLLDRAARAQTMEEIQNIAQQHNLPLEDVIRIFTKSHSASRQGSRQLGATAGSVYIFHETPAQPAPAVSSQEEEFQPEEELPVEEEPEITDHSDETTRQDLGTFLRGMGYVPDPSTNRRRYYDRQRARPDQD